MANKHEYYYRQDKIDKELAEVMDMKGLQSLYCRPCKKFIMCVMMPLTNFQKKEIYSAKERHER